MTATRSWEPPADALAGAPESVAYLARLASSLREEFRAEGIAVPSYLVCAAEGTATFDTARSRYRSASHVLAGVLDERFEAAAAYRSMEEFWADAHRQALGRSDGAYWDSYENGRRRRMESLLAAAFGIGQALLVNSGMGALDVAVRAAGVRHGETILVHERAYFETGDLLAGLYEPQGVRIARVDLTDAEATRQALSRYAPVLVLAEAVLNGPGCDVPVLEPLHDAGVPVILDCSALGHGVEPGLLLRGPHVLYVESGMKYLTRSAGCGVIYGEGDWFERARLCARRTGQQLQGRALHRLRPGEVAACRDRLALHSVRRGQFTETLRAHCPETVVTDARSTTGGRADLLANAVNGGADGCMVFARMPAAAGTGAESLYRGAVARWAAAWAEPRVRAGFGWTLTTGRAYGRDALNTAAGECFARFSVGVEPERRVRELAERLAIELRGQRA